MDMKTLLEHMQAHHGRCDQLYADGENLLLDEQIEEGLESIKSFLNLSLIHISEPTRPY